MKLYARGMAQKMGSPGEFLESKIYGRVIGIAYLGNNNADNDFGWCGVKPVVQIDKENYILDFAEDVIVETGDGIKIIECCQGDKNCWDASIESCKKYDLYFFDMTK